MRPGACSSPQRAQHLAADSSHDGLTANGGRNADRGVRAGTGPNVSLDAMRPLRVLPPRIHPIFILAIMSPRWRGSSDSAPARLSGAGGRQAPTT